MSKKESPTGRRGAGRPPKLDYRDAEGIKSRIQEANDRFGADCADKLVRLYKVIGDLAMTEKAPIKDRVSAAKYCIEFANKYLDEHPDEDEGKGYEPNADGDTTPAKMSLVPKK